MLKTHPFYNVNDYNRLEMLGWKKFYEGSRWDYFVKVDQRGNVWKVAVPWTYLAEMIFYRNGKRISPPREKEYYETRNIGIRHL